MLVFTAVLVAVAAVVLGPSITDAGFVYDDWRFALLVRDTDGFVDELRAFDALPASNSRPVVGVLVAVVYGGLGLHEAAHALLGVALGLLATVVLYVAVRVARVTVLPAAAIGLLSFVFPWSDALRLWPAAGLNELGVALVIGGILLGARGLQSRRWGFHPAGLMCVALGVGTHESTAVMAALSWVVYLGVAPLRPALVRSAVDVAVAVGATAVTLAVDPRSSTGDSLEHARSIAEQAATLTARALTPGFELPAVVVLVPALAVVAWAVLRRDDPQVAPWLALVAGGVALAILGWAPYVPADSFYGPTVLGEGNRTNMVSDAGVVTAIVGLAGLTAGLVGRRRTAVTAGLLGLLLAGYVAQLGSDRGDWIAATRVRERVIDFVRTHDAQPQATLLLFGTPGNTGPNVPTFAFREETTAALQITTHRPGEAEPVSPRTEIACAETGVTVLGGDFRRTRVEPYGRVVFVDPGRSQYVPVTGRGECEGYLATASRGDPLVDP